MKDKLIQKYGEKQAEILINKFTEEEIYDNGFLEKELPEDDKWKEKFLELEKQNKDLRTQLEKEIELKSKANQESAERRKLLENENLTKKELEEKLIELENENKTFKEKFENLQDYEDLKQFKLSYEEKIEAKKKTLLESVEESKRLALSKLDIEEIEMFINSDVPSETPGANSGNISAENSEFANLIKALSNN